MSSSVKAVPLATALSLLVKRVSGMAPGMERDRIAAEISAIKAELMALREERKCSK